MTYTRAPSSPSREKTPEKLIGAKSNKLITTPLKKVHIIKQFLMNIMGPPKSDSRLLITTVTYFKTKNAETLKKSQTKFNIKCKGLLKTINSTQIST
jgi:hypothetical protein